MEINNKTYIFTIFFGFILGIGVWFLIFFNINPYQADLLTIASFYASLFLWLTCLSTLIGYYVRIFQTNNEIIYANLPIAFRQSIFISLTVVTLLIFQSLQVLTIWISGIVILVMILIELLFRTKNI